MPESALNYHLAQADEQYEDPPHVERNAVDDLIASAKLLDAPAPWQRRAAGECLTAALAAACDAEIMSIDEWQTHWQVVDGQLSTI